MGPTRRTPTNRFEHPVDEEPTVVFGDLGRDWNQTITRLMDSGFTYHDAALWQIAQAPLRDDSLLAVFADDYRSSGFTGADAVEWFVHGINALDAVEYANRGWTPWQAARLRRMLHEAEPQGVPTRTGAYTESHALESWWLLARILPFRVLLYVAAGITDQEAPDLERRRQQGDGTIDPAVQLLAALRRQPGTVDGGFHL